MFGEESAEDRGCPSWRKIARSHERQSQRSKSVESMKEKDREKKKDRGKPVRSSVSLLSTASVLSPRKEEAETRLLWLVVMVVRSPPSVSRSHRRQSRLNGSESNNGRAMKKKDRRRGSRKSQTILAGTQRTVTPRVFSQGRKRKKPAETRVRCCCGCSKMVEILRAHNRHGRLERRENDSGEK